MTSTGGFSSIAAATGTSTSFGAILGSVVGQTITSAIAGGASAAVSCTTLGWLLNFLKILK